MDASDDQAAPSRSVLDRLANGMAVLCLGVRHSRTGDIARMAAGAGYGAIWIDLEHSSMSIDCAAQIAATANDLQLAAWVRIPEREYGVIGRLLDCGATGIICPKVETVQEAQRFAAACRFPPVGQRSIIGLLPQAGFRSLPIAESTRRANRGVALQILIESAEGVRNADAMAAIDGVDLLAVGLNDICADLGCPGEQRHPDVRRACLQVAAAAAGQGKMAVIGGVADPAHFAELTQQGFAKLIFAGIDTDLLAAAVAQRATVWNKAEPTDGQIRSTFREAAG